MPIQPIQPPSPPATISWTRPMNALQRTPSRTNKAVSVFLKSCRLFISMSPLSHSLNGGRRPRTANMYLRCDNEDRLCQGNPAPDMFYSHYVDDFHSICDQYTSFPFTVPPVSSLTTTIQPGHCTPFVSACASGTQFDLACSQSYTGPQLDDCLCAPEVLSLQYTCLYLGNVSCRGVPAALSNIPGWGVCSGYSTIFV